MQNAKFVDFDQDPPPAFAACQAFNLRLPVQHGWNTSENRVLLVVEHVDTEDLRTKRFLTNTAGVWTQAALDLGRDYAAHLTPKRPTLAAINFNYFKTYDLQPQEQDHADKMAAKRVHKFIRQMKPHKIIVLGDNAARHLMDTIEPRLLSLRRGRPIEINGRQWTNTIDLSTAYQGKRAELDDEEEQEQAIDHANLLGYVSRCVGNALAGRIVYRTKVKVNANWVNTIRDFKSLFARLMAADVVSVDCETTGLERTTGKLLTIQFGFDKNESFVVPLYHKDTPFSEEQLAYISKALRKFFTRKFDPLEKVYTRFLLGQNLKFDLTQIRQWLQIHTVTWPVWDLMAGEYVLDENMKSLGKSKMPGVTKEQESGAYTLARFCAWYGIDFYENNAFSKADRNTIETRSLDDPGLGDYCGMDAQVCFAIREQQLERSQRVIVEGKPYRDRYAKFVVTQMSNMIHLESVMEHRGDHIDLPWLLKLKDKNGPMLKVLQDFQKQLRDSKQVQKANARLVKRENLPSSGMFGKPVWIFDFAKAAHKKTLFMDVLKLDPLRYGKPDARTGDPQPSFDKFFQMKYKEVPEIDLFTQMTSITTLKNLYVEGFYNKLVTDRDMKVDHRLRPSFGFTGTVTGRSNSFDPNLQNIPTRGKFAKYIKRLFTAPRGCLILKMDYSAHEVRMWGIISGDQLLCSLFINGRWLRQQFRKTEHPVYKQLMDTKGDIHKVNCEYFFKVDAADVTSEQRNSVKSIVFGAIYGRGARAIAEQAKAKVEDIKAILEKFFKRFPVASKWLEYSQNYAVKHGHMFSPIWRMRNMYSQLYGIQNLIAAAMRRGCNAPIQGLAADLGHTAGHLYQIHIERVVRKFKLDPDRILRAGVNTFVHDAIKTDAPYEYLLTCLQVLQWCATTGVMEYYKTHWNLNFPVEVEVEFEFAAHDGRHWKWDWSEGDAKTLDKGELVGGGLRTVLKLALKDQKEVYPDLDIKSAWKQIWDMRKNTELVAYLNENYPILANWKDATHLDTKSEEFKKGLGKLIRDGKLDAEKAAAANEKAYVEKLARAKAEAKEKVAA